MAFARGPQIIRDGLVLLIDAANTKSYPGTGTIWKDLSGKGNDGVAAGTGITLSSNNKGVINSDVGDAQSGIQLPESVNGLPLFTYSSWVKINNSHSYNYIFSNARDCCDTFEGVDLRLAGTKIIGKFWDGTATSTTLNGSNVTLGEWNLATYTFDGVTVKLYENGYLKASSAFAGNQENPTFPMQIARMGYGVAYRLDGQLSMPMIYDRPLSDVEVLQNYKATKSRFI